jgi:CheY-like chemotaxis protein
LDPNLPAILMSAHSAEWLTREGRIRAGTKTLQKPFDKETLLLRLSEVLKEPPAPGPLARDQAFEPLQSRGPTSQVAILVVEDQSAARLAIVEFLRSLGYEVLAAADPKEALDKARERSIGVILTDYRLPGMNGDALAREVKKLWPGAVVLYMSGYGDLKLDPAGPVLKKPVELEVIAASVAGIVGGASKSY